MKKMISVVLALAACTVLTAWDMPRPAGHAPKGWSSDPKAWTAAAKNPCEQDGCVWTCFCQNKPNPALNEKLTLLKPGLAWNYFSAWTFFVNKTHSILFYEPAVLTTIPAPPAGKSVAAGIQFEPDNPGEYTAEIAGNVTVGQPTAGHGLVQIFLLEGKENKAVLLKEFRLNNPKPNVFGKYPTRFDWKQKVRFQKDTRLVLRLQSVNPGPGTCGPATLKFEKFSVK